MPRLQYKSFATPDEVRAFPLGRAEVVSLDESVIGRAVYEPGWRWSTAMAAIAGTASCQLHHLGYSISGLMHVVHEDGQVIDIPPASVYEIPPGHDAWVVGDDPWVTVEWTSARTFGLVSEGAGQGVLVTVLFTDIVDSTATLQRIGNTAWRDLLLVHNARLRDQLNTFRGREVKRPATVSLRFSTAPRGRCVAVRRWHAPHTSWVSRFESGFTRVRSSSLVMTPAVSPFIRLRGSCRSAVLMKSSCHLRLTTSSTVRD